MRFDLKPGEHAVFVSEAATVDGAAFRIRKEGLEIRDAVAIQMVDQSLVAILVRAELNGSIVENTVRTGAGTINIDACRVSVESSEVVDQSSGDWTVGNAHEGYKRPGRSMFTHSPKERNGPANPAGRWPPNQILVHGPDCVCNGTKKVHPKEGHRPNPVQQQADGRIQFNTKEPGYQKISYTAEDGKETVADWDCQPGCPVVALDQQSGDRPGCTSPSDAQPESIFRPGQGGYQKQGPIYGDKGGASRFYRQTQSIDDLIWYLADLVGSVGRVVWVDA